MRNAGKVAWLGVRWGCRSHESWAVVAYFLPAAAFAQKSLNFFSLDMEHFELVYLYSAIYVDCKITYILVELYVALDSMLHTLANHQY